MAKKPATTGTFENPADKQVLAAVAAAAAAGGDPFGDDEFEDDAPAAQAQPAAEQPPADEAAAAALDADDDLDDDDDAADPAQQAADGTPPADEPAAATVDEPADAAEQFDARTTVEIADAKKALRDEKRAAFKKYSEGELSDDEWLAIEERVDTQLEALIEEGALARANEQGIKREQASAIEAIIAGAKADGTIDYQTDPTAANEFNAALQLAVRNPKNAALPFSEMAKVAHKLVLTMRGITPPAAAAAPTSTARDTPPPRVPGKGPTTLANVPAASVPNTNGGITEQLGRLDGLDFQEAVGRMPKAQRDAWLDS